MMIKNSTRLLLWYLAGVVCLSLAVGAGDAPKSGLICFGVAGCLGIVFYVLLESISAAK